ncbi:MAG: Ig-like domain-containing protein, partial [Actinomycetota bacterium]|nr:Ig-like domain-containing protein [Actinomycetota bacterium]
VFTLYYGAAPQESLALEALYALDAEAYALGQNSDPEGPSEGTPVTYLLGFSGLGGTPMRAPHAGEDTYTVPPGETSTLLVTLNDAPDGSVPSTGLEIAWVEQGWGGTVTCGTATCDYTPSPGSLSDYFRYLLSDGHGGFAIGEVTILVEEPEPAAENTEPPSITGSGVVGEELTGHDGDWTSTGEPDGSDLTFDRQWLKDGSPIPGEIGSTYTPVEADLGHELTFQVVAGRPDADPVVATSDPVTVTDERAATNDVRPSISGSGEVGGTLFGDDGSWTSGGGGDGSDLTFARQWLRDGSPVDGATGESYTPGSGDVGSQITFRVTVSRAGADDVVATSDPVTVYRPVAAEATSPPTISGSGVFGEELTGTDGEWVSTGTAGGSDLSFSRRWLRDGSPIPGATGPTYTPVADDVDHDLVLEVRASRPGADDSTATSAPLTITPAAAPVPLLDGVIPLTGRVERFGTVSVAAFDWDLEPDSVSYRWESISPSGEYADMPNGSASSVYIEHAVATISPGARLFANGGLRVTVTARRAGHEDAVLTRSVYGTLAPPLVVPEVPALSGVPALGETLSVDPASVGVLPADTEYEVYWYVNGVFQTSRVGTGDFLLDPSMELRGLEHDRLRDGDRVGVRIIAIQPGRVPSKFSHLAEVTLGLPAGTVTAPPGILGTPKVGETLTVDPAGFDLADGVDPRDVDVTTTWFVRWRSVGVRRQVQSDSETFVLPDWAAGYYVEVEQTLSADRRTSVTAASDPVGPVAARPMLVARLDSRPVPRAGTETGLDTLRWQAYPQTEPITDVDTQVTWLVDGVEVADAPTYTPGDAQVGGYLSARVHGTKDGYSDGRTTVPLGKVRPADEDEAVLDIRVVRSDDPLVRTAANVVICSAFTCLSSYAEDGTTTITAPASTSGTEFSLKVYPGASLIEHHGSVTLTGGQTTELTVELDAPTPLDPDIGLSDAGSREIDTDGDGIADTEVPSVYYRDPQTVTLRGCTGLTGRVWRV